MLPGAMLVMVRRPEGVVMTCPIAVMVTPLSEIDPKPSGVSKTMLPDVVSLLAGSLEPAGSLPRAGRPASLTRSVADTEPAGWSGVMMMVVGSLSTRFGMISRSSGTGKASWVGGSRSPKAKGSPISPTGSLKLPPELVGRPASGAGSWLMSKAAMLSGGTATPSSTNCGTKIAPSGIIIRVPSGISITRSRPETLMSSSSTPAGSTT